MKKTFLNIAIMATMSVGCTQQNPLLVKEFDTPHGAIPFDKIKLEHYVPAFDAAIAEGKAEVAAIANSPAQPTFENTVVALEMSGRLLQRTAGIFFNLNEAETTPAMQALAQEITPKITAYEDDITLNELLFARIKQVYETADRAAMTTEDKMLLQKKYKHFVRKGANLNEEEKEKYRLYSQRLARYALAFKENALAETNAFTLNLTDSADLKGLPADVVEQAAKEAQTRGESGWTFTLKQPSYSPFIKFAENREARKKLYIAYNTRGAQGNEHDNSKVIEDIVNTRLQMANLLGYKTYADYVLEERMAENSANVNQLLSDLLKAATPAAQAELAQVQAFATKSGADFELQNYDWSFYSEKLREQKYNLNEEILRPYFEIERARQGIFTLANKLYGLTFKENSAIPVYHPDVKAYEVFDEHNNFVALYYADLYPRQGKRTGAWMDELRGQYGTERPHIINVASFTRPTATKPALLSFSEFNTMLHEFGHALHGMLAQGNYPSLTGTNVYRDFVEMPSQIMENWATQKDFLDLFAVHYETGEKIPAELVEKIIASQNYLAGNSTLRQLSFGLLDMAYHTRTQPFDENNLGAFEHKTVAATRVLPPTEGCVISSAFTHVFGGGYAAGYYGYKWAEVIDADAFSVFQKNGIFDRATAQSFKDNILSKGGSEHPMVLYKRFRGQAPNIDALLKREGFKQ
ncbi:dipeptidyl carboxypeptidase II [Bacteroidia bacterium]|nr:dipeptidyl carboxypeptidase II [Bacteroidia bacterium]